MPSFSLTGLLMAAGLLAIASPASITPLQRDDFQDGTTQGWSTGGANPNPPTWVADGGPQGARDGYLRIEGSGLPTAGGSLVAFNTLQWTGDYLAAGVTAVRAELRNMGESEIVIRLLFEAAGGGFVTPSAAYLPAGGGWHSVVWPIDPTVVPGFDVSSALSNVTKLRILHSPSLDGGEPIAGVLGVDDVTALTGEVCNDSGLLRGDRALCRVYCETLGCSTRDRPGRACEKIASVLERRTGQEPPCELDGDGDGWVDDLDNCPDDPNADQSDVDGDGLGDVCDNCPDFFNPEQEDTFGDPGVGDACDCSCFSASELADLIDVLSDPDTYQDLRCVDDRSTVKPLTFVNAERVDGAPCSAASQDCSALAAEFTEDNSCQFNPPAPASQVLMGGITDAERDVCRARIVVEAESAGLSCD